MMDLLLGHLKVENVALKREVASQKVIRKDWNRVGSFGRRRHVSESLF